MLTPTLSPPPETQATTAKCPRWMSLRSVLLLSLVVAAIRLTGPCELSDGYHQERAASYVMDILHHGNWLCQFGMYGEVTSKPPMFTWLAALANLPFREPNWFALQITPALATIGIAVLMYLATRRYFGQIPAFLAVLVYLFSAIGSKQIGLVRIDGFFTLTVAATALLGFRAWQTGKGWIAFWIAAAIATLTKGPLGIVLGAAGLLAYFWERRSGFTSQIRGPHGLGIFLYFLIAGGWFVASYLKVGKPLIDVMIRGELVGHAVTGNGATFPLQSFYGPTFNFMARFIPWSILAVIGLWRIWKYPAQEDGQRRFERFLFCWFVVGILLFSFAPHQRPDLIFPLIPAAAIIAGRELERLLVKQNRISVSAAAALICVIGLAVIIFKYDFRERHDETAMRTRAIRKVAQKIRAAPEPRPEIHFLESPYALQFFLNRKDPLITADRALELLRTRPHTVVATADLAPFDQALTAGQIYSTPIWTRAKRERIYLITGDAHPAWAK